MFQRLHPVVALLLLVAALLTILPAANAQSTAGLSTPGTTAYVDPGFRKIGYVQDMQPPRTVVSAAYDQGSGAVVLCQRGDLGLGHVTRIEPGVGAAAPGRGPSALLQWSDWNPVCAVIDPAGGRIFVGTHSEPPRIIKFETGSGMQQPRRLSTLVLQPGETLGAGAVVDPTGEYAYFPTAAGLLKVALGVGDAPMTRIGITPGMGAVPVGLVDPATRHAFFAAAPRTVYKFSLGTGSALPTLLGTLTLDATESTPQAGVLDSAGGHAYIGMGWNRVVKVALGAGDALPTRVGAVDVPGGEFVGAVLDPDHPVAHFVRAASSYPNPHRITSVAIGAGSAPPSAIGDLSLPNTGSKPTRAVLLPGTRYLLATFADSVSKFDLGDGSGSPSLVSSGVINEDNGYTWLAGIDKKWGYAYYLNSDYFYGISSRLLKVRLGGPSDPPRRVGALMLDDADPMTRTLAVDEEGGYIYVGTNDDPARVLKIRIGEGDDPGEVVSEFSLLPADDYAWDIQVDQTHGHLYILAGGAQGWPPPSKVIKYSLGVGDAAPTRLGECVLNDDIWGAHLLLDPVGQQILIPCNSLSFLDNGMHVMKMGSGDNPPTYFGVTQEGVQFNYVSEWMRHFVDAAGRRAYLTLDDPSQTILKYDLGDGSSLPTFIGATPTAASSWAFGSRIGENWIFDQAEGKGYLSFNPDGSEGFPAMAKLHLGALNDPVSLEATIVHNGPDDIVDGGVHDATNGVAHYIARGWDGEILLVGTDEGQRSFLKGTRFTMPEWGAVTEMRFHSHEAAGNVRLALYDNGSPRRRVWESGVVANTADDADLVVPISSGTPAVLSLPAGTYWAAWQVDTRAAVPSYTAGAAGSGFTLTQFFGPMPPDLSNPDIVATNQNWTQYITYTPDDEAPASALLAQGATQVGGAMTGTYSASDTGGSGVATVRLFVKPPGGSWTNAGAVTGGAWSHTPAATGDAADGAYEFATVATDVAGNTEGAPTSADAVVLYNDAENSNYSVTYAGDGAAVFPMTASLNVGIEVAGATPPVTVTVSRATGDATPGAPFDAARLIDERLVITGALNGGTATLTWPPDPASDDGLVTPFDTVFRFESGSFADAHPVAAGASPIVVTGITGFSEWWAGTADARVGEWSLYGE